jgi:glycosyltransferase involved in cell wall biosynthesis
MQNLVSIITPTYNCASFIEETIRSVLAQSYPNWEMIIVDDASTDATQSIVESFADERIRYFRNPTNSGAAYSRNLALRQAKGRWIAFLDSDDIWTPDKLTKQIRFMEENHYNFTYTKYSEIDEQSEDLGIYVTGPKHISKRGMYNYCWLGCLTVMYDASVVGLIQIADTMRPCDDYALWLKVIHKADCYLLDEPLAKYRRRKGSLSSHGYVSLIKWHYRLFHEAEGESILLSYVNTLRNLFFGCIKKVIFVRKVTK